VYRLFIPGALMYVHSMNILTRTTTAIKTLKHRITGEPREVRLTRQLPNPQAAGYVKLTEVSGR